MIKRIYLLLFVALLSCLTGNVAKAQTAGTHEVSGVVKDASGEPIIGASVVQKDKRTNGVITDIDGNFKLKVPNDAVIVVSYVGYEDRQLSTSGKTHFDVVMKESSKALDDVIVIGYGSVKKSNLTSSVSKITSEALEDRPLTTVGEGFQGQLAGVQVQASSGGIPGQEMTIRIRGINTINGDTSPLYVIDGVPRDNMSDINPSDIATVQILKDASATSIYGSRGANGVVLIETKQGKGKPTVTFDVYYGTQTKEKLLDLESGEEWISYAIYHRNVDYMRTGGSLSDPVSERPQDYRYPDWWLTTNDFTDWQKLILRSAPIQNYTASVSSKNDIGSIYLSAGYQDQKGIIINTDYKRYNLRLNTSVNLTKNLKVGANIGFSVSKQQAGGVNLGDRQGKDAAVHHALMMSPLIKQGMAVRSSSNPSGSLSQMEYGSSYIDPVGQLNSTTDKTSTSRVQSSIWAEWNILPGLVGKSMFSFNYDGNTYEYFQPASYNYSEYTSAGNSTSDHTNNWVIQNTLTYDHQFGKHSLNVLLGQSAERSMYYIGEMEATGWPYENVTTLNVASTATLASTKHVNYSNASFFGRISYNYDERYLATFSLRHDGSSRFGLNNQWGTFPSFSVGWKINEESFLKNTRWLNLLKLRISYGTSGNDRIGDYRYMALLSNYNAAYGGSLQKGVAAENLANEDLQWEQTSSLDFGFDFSGFNNRIQLNFDYYVNNTTDLLFDVPIPYTTGFSTQLTNLGKIQNRGWELDVTSHNITGSFRWDTSLNLSSNENEVKDMGNITSFTESRNGQYFITRVGGPVSQFYTLRTNGFLTADCFDADGNALVPIASGQEEGNYRFVDQNGDNVINDNDLVPYGNNLPDLTWGLTNRFYYKNFDLSILLQGQFGGDILYLGARHNDDGVMYNRRLFSRWVRCYKTEEQMAAIPDYAQEHGVDMSWDGETPSPFGNNYGNTDQRIYDATYCRLKNVTLGYTFPKSILKHLNITALRLYVSIDNLYTWDDYPGYTPETSSYGNGTTQLGVDYSTYPLSRKYTFGLSLTF
jgi:TonB-linked SusC/RagA family outer membrane protein